MPAGGASRSAPKYRDAAKASFRLEKFNGPGKGIQLAVPVDDGHRVIFAERNGKVHEWDVDKDRELRSFGGFKGEITSLQITADRKTLLVAAGTAVHLIDLVTGKMGPNLTADKKPGDTQKAGISSDGRFVASCDSHTGVNLWEIGAGGVAKSLLNEPVKYQSSAVLFAPDSSAFAYYAERKLVVRRLPDLQIIGRVAGGANTRLLAGGNQIILTSGEQLLIVDVASGAVARRISFPQYRSLHTDTLEICPDGQHIIQGCSGREFAGLRVLDLKTGESVASCSDEPGRGYYHSVAVSPGGTHIVTTHVQGLAVTQMAD